MPFIDTHDIEAVEKRPGWRGRIFSSATMTFAHWDFAAGSSIHEHEHLQEEVWHILEGELEVTIAGAAPQHALEPGPGAVGVARAVALGALLEGHAAGRGVLRVGARCGNAQGREHGGGGNVAYCRVHLGARI